MPAVMGRAKRSGSSTPVFSNVVEGTPAAMSQVVSWNVSPGSTGQIEYGTSPGVYTWTTTLETSYLTFHSQVISGLDAGTQYYYRIKGVSPSGATGYYVDSFFTTGTPASMYANIYGNGMAVDSRGDRPVDNRDCALRFIASRTSNATKVLLPWRFGDASGYSDGTGGIMRVSIQTESGGAPTGTIVGAAAPDWTPTGTHTASNTTWHVEHTFATPAALTAGTRYFIVMHNQHGTPTTNYCGHNAVLREYGVGFGGTSPLGTRQPAYTDDLAMWYGGSENTGHTPVFDLTYSDGQHDGQQYMLSGCGTGAQSFGGATQVRGRFTVSGGTRTVSGLWVRAKRLSGSGALTVALWNTGGALIESFTIAAGQYTVMTAGCTAEGSPFWRGQAFSQNRTLTDTASYEVRLSAPSGTTYRLESPLREESADNAGLYLTDPRWVDGFNPEVSTDSGSNWNTIYASFRNDFPHYFTVV